MKHGRNHSSDSSDGMALGDVVHDEDRNHSMAQLRRRASTMGAGDKARSNLNAKLANPLAGFSQTTLRERGIRYAKKYQLGDAEDIRAFEIGAVLAQNPQKFRDIEDLTHDEADILEKEFNNRWSQPKRMYAVIMLCSLAAAVQGMGK